MKRMKYLAFLLSLSLMSVPAVVHAESTTDPPNIEVVQQVSGVDKVLLDYIPDDLILNLPSQISLKKTDTGYGFSEEIYIDCISDEQYEVVLSLKSTEAVYTNNTDNSISVRGTASIGGADTYTFTSEDITNGVTIPFIVAVDGPIKDGNYTTDFSFVVDVYRIDEVLAVNKEESGVVSESEEVLNEEELHEEQSGVSQEGAEKATEAEEGSEIVEGLSQESLVNEGTSELSSVTESTEETSKIVNSEENIEEISNEEMSKEQSGVDFTGAEKTTEAEEDDDEYSLDEELTLFIYDAEISADYLSQYPNLEEIFISAGVSYIDANAFDNLAALTVIHYEGTEKQWNEIFTGTLSGVELVYFGTEDVVDEQLEVEVINSESAVDEETTESAEAINPVPELEDSETDSVQENLETENVSGVVQELPDSAQESLVNENESGVCEELPNLESDSETSKAEDVDEESVSEVDEKFIESVETTEPASEVENTEVSEVVVEQSEEVIN